MKKVLTIGIMLLFIGMTITPTTGINIAEQSKVVTFGGNILYVGGNGTGNYSKIQDAINDSSNGDTVYVYDDSSPYYENLNVNKSITLIGEDKDTTVINGSGNPSLSAVTISFENVILSDFSIQKYGIYNYTYDNSVINIESDYNIISDNILTGNTSQVIDISDSMYNNISGNIIPFSISTSSIVPYGISLSNSSYNNIYKNHISLDGTGIGLGDSHNNNIIGNVITGCDDGLFLIATWNNYIYGNTITNNWGGITSILGSANNTFILNNISKNKGIGFYIQNSLKDKIFQNNFIGNEFKTVYFCQLLYMIPFFKAISGVESFIPKIYWDGNYWDGARALPYLVTGLVSLFSIIPIIRESISGGMVYNWFNIDWHPAQEPYEIPTV